MVYISGSGWCKEATINESKSMLIKCNDKTWQLSIVNNRPKNVEEVDMAMYRDVLEAVHDCKSEKKRVTRSQLHDNLLGTAPEKPALF